ncbi:MAG: HAMP domain-containing histidine kinase [Desulfobacteraceae bacterium]|nr:HAMP domain-containing histidine kinase [Desulfobacteraceae bacterium]MBC2752230.1 HAMP domain-containing histidine kinase [Desulfobacteraceae bacterium]
MIKPPASILTKILCWFFLNLALVAAVLVAFFAFQPQVNLHAIFGREASNRLEAAAMLIAHDLNRAPQADWSGVLARHAAIHKVDFVLVRGNDTRVASKNTVLPEAVRERVQMALRHQPPPDRPLPPPGLADPPQPPGHHLPDDVRGPFRESLRNEGPPTPPRGRDDGPRFMMRTRHPTRYWSGIRMPLPPSTFQHREPAFLLAVSDTVTGNGFFFDPLPWMLLAAAVMILSALLWVPMVRNITRPLGRMTRAAESIANGRFDITIDEPRADEIGRLAKTINHMTTRLSGYVTGQKRFLGDVAHELGSPIARIQFGLGALEQRVGKENRQRVLDVLEDVEHMSKLASELLAFSRADLKSDPVKLEPIPLLPVVQAAVKRENALSADIRVTIDPRIQVVASAELLARAFANIVRNAVKYAADAGPIAITAEKKKEWIDIGVRDSGPGVPEEFLDQLFEPFFRPEASRDRDSGGVGLGLAIVKTCVEACQGTVTARNLKPSGFAVTITLNAAA